MAITVRSLGVPRVTSVSSGCCGARERRSSLAGLGDQIQTLEGLERRGLGITTADFQVWTRPPPPPPPPEMDLITVFMPMQLAQPEKPLQTVAPAPATAPAPAPAPAPTGGSSFPDTFAPTNGPLPPAPDESFVPQPPPVEQPPAEGLATNVKVAIAVGGTLVLAALVMRGGK